jgi:hypothetical protein
MFCLSYAYVFSSTILEKRAEQFQPGSRRRKGMRRGQGRREMGRNGPNNVCTCE